MSEGLFILTTIFVAYIVYVIVGESKKAKKPAGKPAAAPKRQAAKSKPSGKKAAVKPAAKPAAKPAEVKKRSTKPQASAAPASAPASKELRNPATGEIAAVPASYRFAKRWIKEALVSEGLVDKVYKNTELDDAATAKIKSGLDKIRTMDKYRP